MTNCPSGCSLSAWKFARFDQLELAVASGDLDGHVLYPRRVIDGILEHKPIAIGLRVRFGLVAQKVLDRPGPWVKSHKIYQCGGR